MNSVRTREHHSAVGFGRVLESEYGAADKFANFFERNGLHASHHDPIDHKFDIEVTHDPELVHLHQIALCGRPDYRTLNIMIDAM